VSTTTQSSCFKQPGVYPGLLQKRVLYDVTAGGIVGWGGLSLLYTQKYLKIAKVHTTAWRFDNEGLVKINFCVKGHEKSLNAAFYNF
jgi:hypothetical protein